VLLVWVVVFAACACQRGADVNWDQRNYHLYNAFALLHGKLAFDLAPAQKQSFHVPVEDLLRYAIATGLSGSAALRNIILAMPAAICAFLATWIAWLVLPITAAPVRLAAALMAALIGATGVAGWSTLSTSMSEALPTAFVLAGLLRVLRRAAFGPRSDRRLFVAGVLFGIAVGLKLTQGVYGVGILAALAVGSAETWRSRAVACGFLALGIATGALLIGGPWWGYLWLHTGNPLFPYYNNIFRAPLFDPVALTDDRFKPASMLSAMLYPFQWALRIGRSVCEYDMRDPRIALGLCGAAGMGVIALWRWHHRTAQAPSPVAAQARRGDPSRTASHDGAAVVAIFFVVACIAWEATFSIYRYLGGAESVSGIVMLLPLAQVAQRAGLRRLIAVTAAGGALAAIGGMTVYPDWPTWARTEETLRVSLPDLPADSTVLLIQDAPLSYVAAFASPSIRFIGADNNLIHPGQSNGLARRIDATIRAASGPLWSLEEVGADADGSRALGYYGLGRGSCRGVVTTVPDQTLRLCRLLPAPSGGEAAKADAASGDVARSDVAQGDTATGDIPRGDVTGRDAPSRALPGVYLPGGYASAVDVALGGALAKREDPAWR